MSPARSRKRGAALARVEGAAGWKGIAGLGILSLFLAAMCSGGAPSVPPPPPLSLLQVPAAAPAEGEPFHIHGDLNVRSGPAAGAPRVRTLRRGDRVRLGPADANGWARVYGGPAGREEYVYRASDRVRTAPPPVATAGSTADRPASERVYHTGPRGGCYTYSASGRKRYVDRSNCE